MLSTSFITGLLASTQGASEDVIQSHSRERANDAVSEMTYPPPPPFMMQSQSPPQLPTSPQKRMSDHFEVREVDRAGGVARDVTYREQDFELDQPASTISIDYSLALPSTVDADARFIHTTRPRRTVPSLYSTKSTKTYVSSFISGISQARLAIINRFKVTPLPPVPKVPMASTDNGHQAVMNLSNLAHSAEHPHMSEKGYQLEGELFSARGYGKEVSEDKRVSKLPGRWESLLGGSQERVSFRRRAAMVLSIILILSVIGIVVGIILSKKHHGRASSNCSGNATGAACTLG
jgi:hypothetical protein